MALDQKLVTDVANLSRWKPGSPELDAARRALQTARIDAKIDALVASAPELSEAQRARISAALLGGGGNAP